MRHLVAASIVLAAACLAACDQRDPVKAEIDIADAPRRAYQPAATPAEAAPEGAPAEVASRLIGDAGHRCSGVTKAERRPDGSIMAQCADGDFYLIARMRGQDIALNCTAAAKLVAGFSCFADGS